ncbi:hypothetical protein G5I_09569 [Acromyrmex echinatior]|uniref:CCHC-type domain-containing protein n=1 Tax=Acromyrmex echinatior TaxID=103372 RepID=F4WUJ8_ACREC|nr:hypothetical protein G5I_09569 [Acromyrmex echinatior]
MGVVPATAPSPKGLPAKQGGQPPVKPGGQPSAKKAKVPPKASGNAPGVPTSAAERDPPPPSIPPTSGDGERVAGDNEATWAQVVSRAAKKAAAKAAKAEAAPPRLTPKSAKAPAAPAPIKKGSGGKADGAARKGSTAAGPKASGKKQAPLPKLRSPSSAAIVVTCADPASYQEVVGKARSSISLKDMRIEDLRHKRAITGALIWEVRGPECRGKADQLAEKLATVFVDRDDVKVSRPTKTSEIRVSGMDDSATPKEVAEELAGVCSRLPPEFKVGGVSKAPNGLGTCWVRCPVEAAKQLVAASKVRVGWSSCKVALLPARNLQCYRCLEVGHVQQKCPSTVDRSGMCYRCGGIDHAARDCRGKTDCPTCHALGRPSGHRIGDAECAAGKAKNKRGGRSPVVPPQPRCREADPRGGSGDHRKPSITEVADVEMAVVEETSSAAVIEVVDGTNGALSRAGSTALLGSLGGESREGKRAVDFVVSSSDSEGRSIKRSRGRPALNPDHAGKFTAEARAKKADKAKARQLRKDHQAILDSEVAPSSLSARKARDRAVELVLEFDDQRFAPLPQWQRASWRP